MTKTAWVFPGQGSQSIGMGADLLELELAQAMFQQAEAILGWSVPEVCQSQDDKVSNTLYTQPCLYVIESILVNLMGDRHQAPDLVAGHSLGEYVALYAAKVFDFEIGLRLVQSRALLMSQASKGMMAALIGFDRDQLDTLISETEDVVLANDNSAGQVVISGTAEAVQSVMDNVKAKRKIPLNVSGAFHSPLVADAAEEFSVVIDTIEFQDAQIPVLPNVEPVPTTQADTLKLRLNQQMTGAVRWRETSLRLAEEGIEHIVEIGPGNVLTGLIKRTCPGVTLQNVRSLADLPDA